MEKLDEEEVKEKLSDIIQRATGNPAIPKPVRIIKTHWITHDLFRFKIFNCKKFDFCWKSCFLFSGVPIRIPNLIPTSRKISTNLPNPSAVEVGKV